MSNLCSFADCDKPVFVKKTSKGPLCNGHYAQYKKGIEIGELRGYSPRKVDDDHGICPIDGCERPSSHKIGLCQSHRKQLASTGTEGELNEIRNYSFQHGAECKMAGCSSYAKSNGYCASHYRQDWGPCTSAGCTRKMYNKSSGYCSLHYSQSKVKSKEGN